MKRNFYIFAIVVNGKVIAAPAREWCATKHEMELQAAAYCTAARAFRKTAGVAVYEKVCDAWCFCHGCNLSYNDAIRRHYTSEEVINLPIYA